MLDNTEERQRARVEQRVGTTLRGKYRVDRVLGIGGMAAVYAATNVKVERRCAVKMLLAELSNIPEIHKRFLREGRAANLVQHRGVVDVLDSDDAEDGTAFLVMEMLEGTSLEAVAEHPANRLDLRRALLVAHELCSVLDVAHANGIVHRDIKPANLFLTKEGRLKVLDFGIARVRDAQSGTATQAGAPLGTPAFMTPEQAIGAVEQIGPRTDVWAVGATLFTLISGRHVHEGRSVPEVIVFAATKHAPSLASVAPETPHQVVEIVDRALAFDVDSRWESAAAMRDAIANTFVALFGQKVPADGLIPHATPAVSPPAAAAVGIVRDGGTAPLVAPARPSSPRAMSASTQVSGPPPPDPGYVAGSAAVATDTAEKRGRSWVPWLAGIVVVGVTSAVIVFAKMQDSPPTSTSMTNESSATPTASPSAAVTSATVVPPSAIIAEPMPTTTTSAVGVDSKPASPTGSMKQQVSLPSSVAPRASASSKVGASARPECNPNYTLDAEGNKRFKPQCFE